MWFLKTTALLVKQGQEGGWDSKSISLMLFKVKKRNFTLSTHNSSLMAHLEDEQYKLKKSVKQHELTSSTITIIIMKILGLKKNLVTPSVSLYTTD